MAHETDRWTLLASHQSDYYRDQLTAAAGTLHNKTAREAGVIPLVASQFELQAEPQRTETAVMWPDPYAAGVGGICMLIGTDAQGKKAFVRIAETHQHYSVEGVMVQNSCSNVPGIYGHQLINKDELGAHHVHRELSPPQIGADFFAMGLIKANDARAQHTATTYTSSANGQQPPTPVRAEIKGISGATSARLIRSLGSISTNIAVGGMAGEKSDFTSHMYDLTGVLLKKSIRQAIRSKDSHYSLLTNENGRPMGVIFESAAHGITVVRRTGLFPDAIAIATAMRPTLDNDTVFIEQHTVRSQTVTFEMTLLPATEYQPRYVVGALSRMNATPMAESDIITTLDETGRKLLEQKIMSLLTEHNKNDHTIPQP